MEALADPPRTAQLEELVVALLNRLPYFGALPAGDAETWSGQAFYMRAALQAQVEHVRRPVSVLDLGAGTGRSATVLAEVLRDSQWGGRVMCVDDWGVGPTSVAPELPALADAHGAGVGITYGLFRHNVQCCGVASYVDHIRGKDGDVLRRLSDASFDMVFLSPCEPSTLRDRAREAKRLVREGGSICGVNADAIASIFPRRMELDGFWSVTRSADGFVATGDRPPVAQPQLVSGAYGSAGAYGPRRPTRAIEAMDGGRRDRRAGS